jgi:hypothetical protein
LQVVACWGLGLSELRIKLWEAKVRVLRDFEVKVYSTIEIADIRLEAIVL